MPVTDNGLMWQAVRRRFYKAVGSSGMYFLIADTGDRRRKSRLVYVKNNYGIALGPQLVLGNSRPAMLMRIAEIHNAQNP